MNEFYKDQYSKFYNREVNNDPQISGISSKSLTNMPKTEMDGLLTQFIEQMFGEDIFSTDCFDETQKKQLINSMMVFVFAHRHNKDDKFLKETEKEADLGKCLHLDFSVVRGVMYHYSKKAQERFFTYPLESFFMAKFATSADGKLFIESKPDSQEKTQRLFKDIEELKE